MEARLFPAGTVPECATPAWYAGIERAAHLEDPAHQARLLCAASFILEAPVRSSLVDLGAGDGGLLSLVGGQFDVAWGYDLQPENVRGAEARGVGVELGDVLNDPIEWGRVAVATEMLEHLVDPHAFVRTIRKHSDWLVCSSPYTETAESHYAHHLWCWDVAGYADLLTDAGWSIVRHETVDMFQVVLAR